MEEKKVDVSRQVSLILGLVLFAFVNVFLFDKKEGIGFSVFSTLTLLTIGLLSNRPVLRILGVVSYLINVIAAIFGFNYLGWLTGAQAIELIFVVWYLYPKDSFLKADTTDKYTYRYRWQQIWVIALISSGIYLVFQLTSSLWAGSFLEFGGNTAFIFGIQYFLYVSLAKSRNNEATFVQNMKQADKSFEELKARVAANPLYPPKKSVFSGLPRDNFIKIAAIWLIVMDLSILSYLIRPNDIGFNIGSFFVLVSIIVSLFVKTVERKDDVFSVIYHKIRPVQPVFFIILLIANAHRFSYGAAYALLFAAVYFVWAINKINLKTLLTLTILIYFMPVFGYISNPFRLGATNLADAARMIVDKGPVNYFNFGNWFDPSFVSQHEDEYDEEDRPNRATLAEEAKNYSEEITVDEDDSIQYAGIWNGDDYDLTLIYDLDATITVESDGIHKELSIKDLSNQYKRMKDLDAEDKDLRFKDYYRMGEVESEYGTYKVYLKMDDTWIKSYEADPSSVRYEFLILGSDREPVASDITSL